MELIHEHVLELSAQYTLELLNLLILKATRIVELLKGLDAEDDTTGVSHDAAAAATKPQDLMVSRVLTM